MGNFDERQWGISASAVNPARSLPRVRMPRRRARPCPDDVVRGACKSEDPRVVLAIRIGAETGLRRCEVAALRRDDVEGDAGEKVLVVRGKGGHERIVPISDDLAAVLSMATGEWVFPGQDGGHLSPSRLGQILRAALPPGWTPHTLRHRFGTVAYEKTGDIRAVQDLMGHASPVTTAIYTRVSNDAMRRAALAAALGTD